MTDEMREAAALRVARLRLQHWLDRLAAAKVNHEEEELQQATKFVAGYQFLVNALESVKRDD